jgi:hypothetical protein
MYRRTSGAFVRACSNRSRNRAAPTPTNISAAGTYFDQAQS